MLNVGVDLTVSFGMKNQEREMTVIIDGGAPIISNEFVPPNYTSEDLSQFAKTFYSPELSTFYKIIVKQAKLVVTHPRISDFDLTPLKKDLFSSDGGLIKFKRNENNELIGMSVSSGRVRNLWFEKAN